MMGIKEGLLLLFIIFLIKSPLHLQINLWQEVVLLIMRLNKIYNQQMIFINQLLENLKKEKIYSGIKDNIWGAYLADVQLISKFNKGFRFLLCVIDIFSKYAWVVPLKDKKGISIVNAFQKILKESDRKPNKIWVDKGS